MIRRLVLLAVTGALMMALAASVALAQENGNEDEQEQCFLPEGCSISGDGSGETLVGGIGPDYIIGSGGEDRLEGRGNGD